MLELENHETALVAFSAKNDAGKKKVVQGSLNNQDCIHGAMFKIIIKKNNDSKFYSR